MDNTLKGFLIAAGVIITCVIIGIAFFISKQAKTTSNNGTSQVSKMTSEYQDVELSLYDNVSISGGDVIALINEEKGAPIFVNVKTAGCTAADGVYYIHSKDASGNLGNTAGIYNASTVASTNRINERASFRGTIYKDTNNVIIGVYFVQE